MLGVRRQDEALSKDRSTANQMIRKMISGGLAGTVSWVIIYPLDVAKTNI